MPSPPALKILNTTVLCSFSIFFHKNLKTSVSTCLRKGVEKRADGGNVPKFGKDENIRYLRSPEVRI
jgi:hypothetical protein